MARIYDRLTRNDEDYDKAIENFSKFLEPDQIVLDYACGPGVVSFKIAADVKEVHGIDTSTRMIALANEKAREQRVDNVHFAKKTIFDETLLKESFDSILAFNILHLVEDASKVLDRAAELLKPGGLLISSTPCLGDSGAVLRTFLRIVRRLMGLSYLWNFKTADVVVLIQESGYEILESELRGSKIKLCFVIARKK